MQDYWFYWRRGWWVVLMVLAIQLVSVLVLVPSVMISRVFGAYGYFGMMPFYLLGAVFVSVPFGGWLLQRIVDERLTSQVTSGTDVDA